MDRRSFFGRASAWLAGLVGVSEIRWPGKPRGRRIRPRNVGTAFDVGDLVALDENGRAVGRSTVRYDGKGGFQPGPWRASTTPVRLPPEDKE